MERKNERSWAIEIVSEINHIVDCHDLIIKHAGGESTISTESAHMFPDLLLYGDKQLSSILQGWEIKMPDVAITNATFIKDAQRKAKALELESCLIWNFTYAKLFVWNEKTKRFEVTKGWKNPKIRERADVATYEKEWKATLRDVVITVNEYLCQHQARKTTLEDLISDKAIRILIDSHKDETAENYRKESYKNAAIKASISRWWKEMKTEYMFDETDMYKAFARSIILNWAYKILFAHLIKRYQVAAMAIDKLDYDCTPTEANTLFDEISSTCDFYNIFRKTSWNDILPTPTWRALIEYAVFLKNNSIRNIDQSLLQNILEGTIKVTRREMSGQFTTPNVLARILANITIHDWTGNTLDPCCGTGTIPHAIVDNKKAMIGAAKAIETTWASDKYQLPLQIANISITSYDTINMPCRLFKRNALELRPNDTIRIVNPENGKEMKVELPLFDSICTNLPFVQNKNIPKEDKDIIKEMASKDEIKLDGKSDLCYVIALQLCNLLKENGYLGIITSNSWLGTESGDAFYHALIGKYDLLQVHISGKERWFQNAKVVTTILILRKKQPNRPFPPHTSFYVWKKDLESINKDKEAEETIINDSLLDSVSDDSLLARSAYSKEQIENLHNLKISYNALFHHVSWLLDIKNCLVPLKKLFSVIRGSRRGWDDMFFPPANSSIEECFLHPTLVDSVNVTHLKATPDRKAFCCGLPLTELQKNYPHAFDWIENFKNINNSSKTHPRPLPVVLQESAKKGDYWYQMRPGQLAEMFITINPNRRIFFGRFKKPTFINQRLIGLNPIDEANDKELLFSLLNSVLMQFFIEATGFGRGLGALDLSKNHLAECMMLNPNMLSTKAAEEIKRAFSHVIDKRIMNVEDNMKDKDWQLFNHTVLKAYGIEEYYDKIYSSLLSLQAVRLTAKEKHQKTTK